MARHNGMTNIIRDNDPRYYIDKEELTKEDIIRVIDEVNSNIVENNGFDYHVLSLTGLGGRGKSMLIRQVINMLECRADQYTFINFETQYNGIRNRLDFMLELRNILVKKYNFVFPNFDLYAIVASSPSQCRLSNYNGNGKRNMSVSSLRAMGEEGLKLILDTFSLSFVNIFIEGIKDLKQSKSNQKFQRIINNLEEDLCSEPREFFYNLREAFIIDYNANVKKYGKALVHVIDSFENYPNNDSHWLFDYSNSNDSPNGLCHCLDKTVWIISSRECLPLVQEMGWDENYSSIYNVDKFTLVDTSHYLSKWGIEESNKNIFYEFTKGEPLLSFYLSKKIAQSNKSSEDVLRHFSNDSDIEEELVLRYLKYLESEVETGRLNDLADRIKIFATLGYWRKDDEYSWPDDILIRITSNNNAGSLDEFYSKSFIDTVQTKNGDLLYTVQKNIKEILLTKKHPRIGTPIIDDIEKLPALKYLSNKILSDESNVDKDIDQIVLLVLSLSHRNQEEKLSCLLDKDGYLYSYLQSLRQNSRLTECLNLLLFVLQKFELKKILPDKLILLITELIEYAESTGIFKRYEEILEILGDLPTEVYNTAIVANFLYATGRVSECRNILLELFETRQLELTNYDDFLQILLDDHNVVKIKEVLSDYWNRINSDIHSNKDRDKHLSLYQICYMRYLSEIGDYKRVVDIGDHLAKECGNTLKENSLNNKFLDCFAIALSRVGELSRALEVNKEILNTFKIDDELTIDQLIAKANIYNNIATIYYKNGDVEKSSYYDEKSWNIRSACLPKDHQEFIQSQNNRAMYLMDLKKYPEAIGLLQNCLEYNISNFGESHIKVAYNAMNLGLCYLYTDQYKEASKYFKQSYFIKEKYYKKARDILMDLNKTLSFLLLSDSYQLQKENLEEFEKRLDYLVFQINNCGSVTKRILDNLSNVYENFDIFILKGYEDKIVSSNVEANRQNFIDIIISSYVTTFIVFSGNSEENISFAIDNFYSISDTLKEYQDCFINEIQSRGAEAHSIVLDYYNLGKKLAKQRILRMIPITDEQFFQKLHCATVMKLFSEELRGKIEMCYGTSDS